MAQMSYLPSGLLTWTKTDKEYGHLQSQKTPAFDWQRDLTWYDKTRHEAIRHDTIRHECDTTRHGTNTTRHECDTTRYDTKWHDTSGTHDTTRKRHECDTTRSDTNTNTKWYDTSGTHDKTRHECDTTRHDTSGARHEWGTTRHETARHECDMTRTTATRHECDTTRNESDTTLHDTTRHDMTGQPLATRTLKLTWKLIVLSVSTKLKDKDVHFLRNRFCLSARLEETINGVRLWLNEPILSLPTQRRALNNNNRDQKCANDSFTQRSTPLRQNLQITLKQPKT